MPWQLSGVRLAGARKYSFQPPAQKAGIYFSSRAFNVIPLFYFCTFFFSSLGATRLGSRASEWVQPTAECFLSLPLWRENLFISRGPRVASPRKVSPFVRFTLGLVFIVYLSKSDLFIFFVLECTFLFRSLWMRPRWWRHNAFYMFRPA